MTDPKSAASPEPEKSGWWCEHCECVVPGKEVTCNEYHEICGYPVGAKPPPASAERIAQLESLLRIALASYLQRKSELFPVDDIRAALEVK